MPLPRRSLWCALLVFVATAGGAVAQPFGLLSRQSNSTLTLPPALAIEGYTATNAFPGILLTNPIALATPPGETNRLFILERRGIIVVITNLAAPTRTTFLDLTSRGVSTSSENGALGLAFDPGYATNRRFYVFYSLANFTTSQGTGLHQRVSRFQTDPANPNAGLLASEVPLITQYDEAGNHNGGDLHFGPDGYLYVAVGDEGGANDQWNNSQTIRKDFFGGILRIDPNMTPGNVAPTFHPAHSGATNYLVPIDNPWVFTPLPGDTNSVGERRTEFYATGLRNPWRMSFDPVTGWLWCADVGQNAREEINIITNGGNYGWAYREGFIAGPKAAQSNSYPGAILSNPIFDYPRTPSGATNVGTSVTGGVVYRGTNIPDLHGDYVFADYVSGNVWALHYDGTNVSRYRRLFVDADIVSFGLDPSNGDVLICDFNPSQVKRLIYTVLTNPPPATLAHTGAFTNLMTLTPHAGIVPYTVNVPFWSDNAHKTRWFSLPNTNLKVGFHPTENWSFPASMVWIKHFDLITNHLTGASRRLETRFLVKQDTSGYGLVYRWADGATNALLVGENGLDEALVITDPGGVLRTQVWRYPSRAECLACHTPIGGFALGFNTHQMNCDKTYTNFHGATGVTDNQIRALNQVGYFTPTVSNLHTLPALAPLDNPAHSLEYRARSYLFANCANCHQPGGPALGYFDTRVTTPLSLSGLLHGAVNNDFGNPNSRVIVPGSLADSMLYQRVAGLTGGRMPPIGSNLVDTNGMALLEAWINSAPLVAYQTFSQWQVAHFGSTVDPAAQPGADPDGDGLTNETEHLLGLDPLDASDWKVSIERSPAGDAAWISFPHLANRGFDVQWKPGITSPAPWQSLNVPANRPFIPASDFLHMVEDPFGSFTNKSYRVRIYEP